jgi:serine/threonine protein kinase
MSESDEAPALGPGALLGGRYRLTRRIASGGMASVWLALDERLDRPVAVKVLSEALVDEPGYLARFRREVRIAAGLSHPGLVRVFDFGATGERPYLVMEHVEGGSLQGRIADGSATELDAGRLAEQLLEALAHIHAAAVVHRDVKPANVLLDADGRARLTDFGVAQPEHATRITGTGEMIGTLRYMAPELLEGKPASERSDLYACGVLLRECLGPRSPGRLADLADRLAAPDPAARPHSATAALEELRGAPPRTAPTVPLASSGAGAAARRLRKIAIPAPALAAIVAAVAALIAVGLAGDDGGPSRESGEEGARREAPASPPDARAESPTTTEAPPQEPGPAEPPAAAPPPAGPPAGRCEALKQQRDALTEARRAAEHDPATKEEREAVREEREAVREDFNEREEALREDIDECKEAERENGYRSRGRGR